MQSTIQITLVDGRPSLPKHQHSVRFCHAPCCLISAQAGGEPRCLMDYWAQNCLAEVDEAAAAGVPPPGHCSDAAMADTVMDFLFASQDASTSSLVWTLCLMADRPDVLAKVRDTSGPRHTWHCKHPPLRP